MLSALASSLVLCAATTGAAARPALPFAADAAAELPPWTILVYGAADNNADGPILEFLDGVRKAIDDDPGIQLLLLLDRHEKYSDYDGLPGGDFTGARLFRLHADSAERLEGGEELPEITLEGDTEIDSADATNLRQFIAWGKAHYPAKHMGLMIYSHANGTTMCPDDESGNDMGIPELSHVLGEASSLDFMALELCNMGGLEIAYQWRPGPGRFGADVLLAIPNAGPPLDWDRAFARIRSPGHAGAAGAELLDPATMTATDFGRLVIEEGRRGRELAARERPRQVEHEAAGCYDLRKAADVKRALDALSVALASDDREVFLEMRGPGPIGDAIHYEANGPFVDLYDLCQRASECDALGDPVRVRAREVMKSVDELVIASFGMSGLRGFRSDVNGVYVILPAGEGRWKNFTWYTPQAHLQHGKDIGRWDFLADGATPGNGQVENWFELLDFWFDSADDTGGINGYRY